jgi:hypothetical protein
MNFVAGPGEIVGQPTAHLAAGADERDCFHSVDSLED